MCYFSHTVSLIESMFDIQGVDLLNPGTSDGLLSVHNFVKAQ